MYFIPADISLTGRGVERRYLDILRAVRQTVSIPVTVKLNPYFSSTVNMAVALQDAGGLVLFNRFYQPDLDIVALKVLTDFRLSEPDEIRLPLLWLAILAGRTRASLAATTGVTTSDDVVKYLLAFAVETPAIRARNGPGG